MDKLPEEFKKKWVAALRSGEYKQGRDYLYDPFDDQYCCLGVAGAVCGVDKEVMKKACYLRDKDYQDTTNDDPIAPESYPKLITLGIKDNKAHVLASMNDEGKSFSQIADYIEKNL
jgi:hypothetical protein